MSASLPPMPPALSRPAIYAHRGSSLLLPENTAAAFDWALSVGADVLETDVRLSRDGHVMVTHDATLQRTTTGRGRVIERTAAALEGLDAGHRFRSPAGLEWHPRDARIMTLDAMFERYPQVRINIDIKDPSPAAADAVADTLLRNDRVDSVTVGSFHASALRRFRQRLPQAATAAGRNEVAGLYFNRRPRASALPFRFAQIPVRWMGLPLATPAFIASARAHGVEPVYWTINDEASMRRLIERSVAGIVTDRPDRLAALLGVPARA